MAKEKAYCIVSKPRLFATVEEAMRNYTEEDKLENLVVCVALGTPEAKFKVKKGVFPFGVVKTIPKDAPAKVSSPQPLVETPEVTGPEPCTFCPKLAVRTFFDPDKQPFVVCA